MVSVLAQIQDNVSKCGDMSTKAQTYFSFSKIQLSVLVEYKADIIIISLKCNLFSP
jgi:hypothetical protein